MKPSSYPTPDNDNFTALMNGVDDATHLVALDLLSRDLEQRLSFCRQALHVAQKSLEQNIRPDIVIQNIEKALFVSISS
jgi:hypothetical protein